MYWVREINRKRFSEELTTVRGGGSVLTNSPLWGLVPLVESDGIVRAGGRLEMSNLTYDAKHLVILPIGRNITSQKLSPPTSIVKFIITLEWTLRLLNYDRRTGLSMEENKLSEGRERECNVCKVGRRHRGEQIMVPLPEARLDTSLHCFAHCLVNFVIKLHRKVTAKCYLCEHTSNSSRNSLLTGYSQLS